MSTLKVENLQKLNGNQFPLVGQVKSVMLSTQTFTNSTALAETEATLSITPSSTSSKILIQWDHGHLIVVMQ